MKLELKDNIFEFKIIEIEKIEDNLENLFFKNNKKLKDLFYKARENKKNRYYKLYLEHFDKYSEYHDYKLGDFLMKLKNDKNPDYLKYLNNYGDKQYCFFRIRDFLKDKGIYCFIVDNEIKYIGRCRKNFKTRINNDYGKISAYNCLLDGQATNCNINSNVNNLEDVKIGICVMNDKTDEEIINIEKYILSQNNFCWNIQKT